MSLRATTALVAVLLTAVAAATAWAGRTNMLDPNPANHPSLISKPLESNRYDGAGGCTSRVPKGTRALKRWLKHNTKRRVPNGIIRCDGGVHGTGRALDWGLDARKKRQRRLAMRVINTWTASDKRGRPNALARRMGVQLIIYNCRWWQAGSRRWRPYGACSGGRRGADPTQGHIDHIHVELTKRAARLRTSFWRSGLADGGAEPEPESGTGTGGVGG